MLAFYFAPGSSSMAPHIGLHEIGVPFEPCPVSFARKAQREPRFLAMNPEGKVPVLVIDGRPLTEVAGILFYLARAYPDAGLLPCSGAEDEARVVAWMSFIASTIHRARRGDLEDMRRGWGLAEQRLAGRPWAVDQYSIADIHLFRLFWRYARSYSEEARAFPALCAHHAAMMERPAVRMTIAAEVAVGYELPN